MAYEAERLEILKMVEAGKISPEEGMRLLRALRGSAAPPGEGAGQAGFTTVTVHSEPLEVEANVAAAAPDTVVRDATTAAEGKARWFRLRVEEPGGQRVNLMLPLRAMPFILRAAARWVPEAYRDTLTAAAQAVETDFRGDILAVEEPGGERVRIWIE